MKALWSGVDGSECHVGRGMGFRYNRRCDDKVDDDDEEERKKKKPAAQSSHPHITSQFFSTSLFFCRMTNLSAAAHEASELQNEIFSIKPQSMAGKTVCGTGTKDLSTKYHNLYDRTVIIFYHSSMIFSSRRKVRTDNGTQLFFIIFYVSLFYFSPFFSLFDNHWPHHGG